MLSISNLQSRFLLSYIHLLFNTVIYFKICLKTAKLSGIKINVKINQNQCLKVTDAFYKYETKPSKASQVNIVGGEIHVPCANVATCETTPYRTVLGLFSYYNITCVLESGRAHQNSSLRRSSAMRKLSL